MARRAPIENNETPFKCSFTGCNASYRRKEHLQRHRTKHSQKELLKCPSCERSFGRSDTLRRHLKQNHKIHEPTNRARKACESCHIAKCRCEGGQPCDECIRRGVDCVLEAEKGTDPQREGSPRDQERTVDPESTTHVSHTMRNSTPNLQEKRDKYIELYFERFHPIWSFIHRASFHAPREVPLMVQSMIVIGLWATGDEASQSAAKDLHNKIDAAIRDQTEKWDASVHDGASSSCRWPLATFQAILLHIIFSCMLKSQNNFNFSLSVAIPSETRDMLAALVRSCRKLGMFYYPNILAQYRHSGDTGLAMIFMEETKRFNLALYRICRIVSQASFEMADFPPEGSDIMHCLLKPEELQFPIPKGRHVWDASTRTEWNRVVSSESIETELEEYAESTWISRSAEMLGFL